MDIHKKIMEIQTALQRAITIVGSATALADLLGITKGAVSQWKDEGRKVPADYCPSIERITDGAVRCEELRPDVDWAYLRSTTAKPNPTTTPTTLEEAERNGGMRMPMHTERVK